MEAPFSAQLLLLRLCSGTPPDSVEPLRDAWTSRQSWRARWGDTVRVLKPPRAGPQGMAQARHEFAAMEWAHGHGLAPQPLELDEETGWLAHVYTPGDTPWEDCTAVAKRLQTLHALPLPLPAWPRCDPLTAARDSVGALHAVEAVSAAQRQWLMQRLASAQQALASSGPGALAPCHNDVQPFNLVRGPQPLLIDWEDAALGDPLWDAASWVASLDLPSARHADFLRDPRPQDLARLAAWRTVAEVYFLAWGLLRPAWRALELERLRQRMG